MGLATSQCDLHCVVLMGPCAINDLWRSKVFLKMKWVYRFNCSSWFPSGWRHDLVNFRWRSDGIVLLESLTWPITPFCKFDKFCTWEAHCQLWVRLSWDLRFAAVRSLCVEMSHWHRLDDGTRFNADSEPWGPLHHCHLSAVRQLAQSIRINSTISGPCLSWHPEDFWLL